MLLYTHLRGKYEACSPLHLSDSYLLVFTLRCYIKYTAALEIKAVIVLACDPFIENVFSRMLSFNQLFKAQLGQIIQCHINK